jgi:hypothetical protein
MSSNLYCILSYCDSPEKVSILENTVKTIRKAGFDTLVISPIPLPSEVTALSNYFVYQKDNPVLEWPEKALKFCKTVYIGGTFKKMLSFLPDYGFTVFNQIKSISAFTDDLEYTQYTFINYDTVITSEMLNKFNYNLVSKVDNEVDGKLFPCLLFFSFTKQLLFELSSSINRQSYIECTTGGIPEDYLRHLLKDVDVKVWEDPIDDLADFKFSEDEDPWNFNTDNQCFKLFFDERYLIVYTLVNEIKINIDGEDILLQENFITDLPKQNFGFYHTTNNLVDLTNLLKSTVTTIIEING